jgi:hypothetical protein
VRASEVEGEALKQAGAITLGAGKEVATAIPTIAGHITTVVAPEP